MGKDNRSWHRATQRSPQELAEALAALAADVGEPSPRQRPRRTPAPPIREPWTDPVPEWPEPELEAEPVPEAHDLRPSFPLSGPEPEPESVREMPAPTAPENAVKPAPEHPELTPEHAQPAPEHSEPAPEARRPAPEALEQDPEPPPGGLIVGRSLTGGERPPTAPEDPTFQEQWDLAPPPDVGRSNAGRSNAGRPAAGTPITARATWMTQGVRSRAAGGRMRPATPPRIKPTRAGYRSGSGSRKRLIFLVAGVLVVLLVIIIALGGGGSSKTSSTGSVRQSVSSTPKTVVIPPPATSATTPNSAAPASHHAAKTLRARCKVAKFRKHHPHKCHVA